MNSSSCPGLDVLSEAWRNKLNEERQSALLSHVEGCETCQRVLEQLDQDDESFRTLVGYLRAPNISRDSCLQDAMENIRLMSADAPSSSTHRRDTSLDFLSPSDDPSYVGRLGRYDILGLVGSGGMGIVLKGYDSQLQRIVAIKVLAPELSTNANARNRFRREGQAAAAVSHDHVVTIHSVDEAQGLPHLVMECISGRSLEDRIKRSGPLELKEVLRIGMQAASGLAAAHAQGLVHRDIKPANILLENGVERVKITDFGLARAVDDVRITRPGVVTGTPEYMSPEQARGEAVDHRSDLFSLGSVLYAMCTGRAPFRADNTVAMIHRVCEDDPRPIQDVNSDIPEWLVNLIEQLLEKRAEDRIQSAQEVTELLEKYLAHVQNPSANAEPIWNGASPADSRRRRRLSKMWLTAAAVVLAIAGSLSLTEARGVTSISSTIIRVVRGDGTLVIQVDDPHVAVAINGDDLVVTGAGIQEVRLKPGKHEVVAMKEGEELYSEFVTISRGGKQVVTITQEKAQVASSSPQTIRLGSVSSVTGAPAPNGKFLPFVDWSTGDLAVRERTGDIRRLTHKGTWADSSNALRSVVSPDSQTVAYSWFTNKGYYYELRTVSIDGDEPKILFSKPEVTMMHPHQWSADGRHVLVVYQENQDNNRIALISMERGSVQVLKDLGKRYPIKVSMSPDNRYVVYDLRTDSSSPNRDIYLLDTADQRESLLIDHQATDYGPMWTPDGDRIVFFSDRSGSVSLYGLGVRAGQATSQPKLVWQDLNRCVPLGFTDDGSLYYQFTTGLSDVYEAEVDPESATVAPSPTKVTKQFEGFNASPSWSPDGNSLAFVSFRGPMPTIRDAARPDSGVLVIRSLDTGDEIELAGELSGMSHTASNEGTPPLRWSPDSRSIMVHAASLDGAKGIYQVDVESEKVTPLVLENSSRGRIQWADWSNDGSAVVYSTAQAIIEKKLDGGDEEVILRASKAFSLKALDVSPDGERLAIARSLDGDNVIQVIPTNGGEPSEVARLRGPGSIYTKAGIVWSPDGKSLLFGKSRSKGLRQQSAVLSRVAVNGGNVQELGLEIENLFHFDIHPDGKRLVYSAGNRTNEVSILRAFLPN